MCSVIRDIESRRQGDLTLSGFVEEDFKRAMTELGFEAGQVDKAGKASREKDSLSQGTEANVRDLSTIH